MKKEKLIEIINYLKNSTEGEFEYHEDDVNKIIVGTYDGGNDSGYFSSSITIPNIENLGDFDEFIEEGLLRPEYGTYAFEGHCHGVVYYNRETNSFEADGHVSYEEWRTFTESISVEKLIS